MSVLLEMFIKLKIELEKGLFSQNILSLLQKSHCFELFLQLL